MTEKEQKNYILPEKTRDTIVKYLDGTSLPHSDVKNINSALMNLKEVKEDKKKK